MSGVSLDIPKHVAIVMDGNGRWSQKRGHPRVFGHVRGATRVKGVVEAALELGIQSLTLYAFSTENWSRPEQEKRVLWQLLKKYLIRHTQDLQKENIRLNVIGEWERLSSDVREILDSSIQKLSKNNRLHLNFALSYGSKSEIIRASQKFAQDCVLGLRQPQELTPELMEHYLWTSVLGPLAQVDLFIRTSGEYRLSNFMLWQSAYAEFLFLDTCWPDFQPQDFKRAVEIYGCRERRFGSLSEQDPSFSMMKKI